jgi:hypothetical protein
MRATTIVLASALCACGGATTSAPPPSSTVAATETAPPAHGDERRIAIGTGFGCALIGGHASCWGHPPLGVDVDLHAPPPLEGVVELDARSTQLLARYADGSVRVYEAVDGQAPGTFHVTNAPVTHAIRIQAGTTPCAMTSTGELSCWYASSSGEVSVETNVSIPDAIDFLVTPSNVYGLDAHGTVRVVAHGPTDATPAVVPGARALFFGASTSEIRVRTDDGLAPIHVAFEALTAGEPTPALDFAAYGMGCTLVDGSHATCVSNGHTTALSGFAGAEQIAVAESRVCVLGTSMVDCMDLVAPTRVVELSATSTGLVEQGRTLCATSDASPWRCLEHGHVIDWSSRGADCTGLSWFDHAPDGENQGWTFCGSELCAYVDSGNGETTRAVPFGSVARVYGGDGQLVLQMRNGNARPLRIAGEAGPLGPVITGFEHISDFDAAPRFQCAITTAGVLRCASSDAGAHAFDVAGIAHAAEVETSVSCACVRTTEGTVQCFAPQATPTPHDAGLTGITRIAGHADQTCALDGTGHLWCTTFRDAPLPAHASGTSFSRCDAWSQTILEHVASIEAGEQFVCARLTTGRVLCWGNDHALDELTVANDVMDALTLDPAPMHVLPP